VPTAAPTLVGRETELGRVRALIDAARAERSGTLVLLGPPGIGKTTLLRAGVAQAQEHGMTVLQARGYERESDFAYGALLQLLRPVLELREALPEVQRHALGVALALEPAAPLDAFAVPAAVLNLLSAAAQVAHREGVAFLAAARDEAGVAAAVDGLPLLAVGPLPADDAVAVVTANHRDVPATVAATLVERTGGNPLALVEIPALLTPGERSGREPLEGPLPLTEQLERGFGARVAALDGPARRALLLAAMLDDDELRLLHRALTADGAGPQALEAAERAGLVAIAGDSFDFRHPLVRSAVQHGATNGHRADLRLQLRNRNIHAFVFRCRRVAYTREQIRNRIRHHVGTTLL